MQAVAKTRQALRSLDVTAIESWALRLTVVFHPDLERLGASLSLGTWTGDHGFLLSATVMGRNSPLLDDGKPLSEAHVSRRALGISKHSSGVRFNNLSDTSPTRLGPDDAPSMSLTLDELKQGMGLRFGHGVVGFIRLIPLREIDVGGHVICLEEESFEGGNIGFQSEIGCVAMEGTEVEVVIF